MSSASVSVPDPWLMFVVGSTACSCVSGTILPWSAMTLCRRLLRFRHSVLFLSIAREYCCEVAEHHTSTLACIFLRDFDMKSFLDSPVSFWKPARLNTYSNTWFLLSYTVLWCESLPRGVSLSLHKNSDRQYGSGTLLYAGDTQNDSPRVVTPTKSNTVDVSNPACTVRRLSSAASD